MSLVIDEEVANRAARIIQRAWRCWVNKAPFKWCKARLKNFNFKSSFSFLVHKIDNQGEFSDFPSKMKIEPSN